MEDRWKILSIARTKDIFIKPFNKSVNTQGPSGQNTWLEKRFFAHSGVIFLKKPVLPFENYSSALSGTALSFNPAIRRTPRCPERAVPLLAPAFFAAGPEDLRRTMTCVS